MMVTFISECEKKALDKTRRVLDAFADRLGARTWQTVITDEGLQTVKKMLRATASKNTAVACHWIRSRSRSELVWIVGNRSKFDKRGVVPVNTTQKDIMNALWENDWRYLPLIKSLSALAALFHDWGKSSDYFQTKLRETSIKGDPLRHEWITIILLNAFVDNSTDEQWLLRLSEGKIDGKNIAETVFERFINGANDKPLSQLSNAASVLAWLILSHHRLPAIKSYQGEPLHDHQALFQLISQNWGYENRFDETELPQSLKRCFIYSKGLPSDSGNWLQIVQKNARKLLDCLPLLEQGIADGSWRLILHYSRLALMLGDHWHSSKNRDKKWKSNLDLYANTDSTTKELKQKLDEHLIGVAKQAVRIAHLLPAFESRNDELQRAYDVKPLKQKSPAVYKWQDAAVSGITAWRIQQGSKANSHHFGFFAVNMASTGKGKTFANAKIMRALSSDGESLRYILALGLRTLTLQTGDEYRERVKLDKNELAVLIGSRAILNLHNIKNPADEEKSKQLGSESEETLLDNEIHFDATIPEDNLTTVLGNEKNRQFLYAPVLCCTIDHLMAATETKKGGRYILPVLRLMSSDLVIDEIDDFDGKDLISIGRLIHIAGMLGRKVMISSATIPPDLAEGYYNAYQAGWTLFARMRERSPVVGCAWIDEFSTTINNINSSCEDHGIAAYRASHKQFIEKRCEKLQQQPVQRKAAIIPCSIPGEISGDENIRNYYFASIQKTVLEQHLQHNTTDIDTGKTISFGVVRFANIKPCIDFTRFLLNADFPADVEIRTMAYHSRQVLIMRSEQEKHLDKVLKRKDSKQGVFSNARIRTHLKEITAQHVIFILVASPVEEVGRDHDFDWAVVEPSSYRSFIQLAGRVMRHREPPEKGLESPNVAIMQYNLKGLLKSGAPVFIKPGYESADNRLRTQDLFELVNYKKLAERLDAQPRIRKNETLYPHTNLADLEHECIHQLLSDYGRLGPEAMQGWLTGYWWMTAVPQMYVRFREGNPQVPVYLVPTGEDGTFKFAEKDDFGKPVIRENLYNIERHELTEKERKRLWLQRDYPSLLEKMGEDTMKAALIYGEIGLPVYGRDLNDIHFIYSSQLGLM
jgi:CRISPR-associated endonuclease/helicase Cas3